MIPIKINNFNTNFEQQLAEYNNFIDCNNFSNLICPLCKTKGQFSRNSSYDRNYIYTEDNNVIDTKIAVTVIKCKACGKYHALLPTFILPYHVYSAYIIMATLEMKLIQQAKLKEVLNCVNIPHQLFYYWLGIFHDFIPATTTVLKTASKKPSHLLKLILDDLNVFLSDFYSHYFSIFFLNNKNHPSYILT